MVGIIRASAAAAAAAAAQAFYAARRQTPMRNGDHHHTQDIGGYGHTRWGTYLRHIPRALSWLCIQFVSWDGGTDRHISICPMGIITCNGMINRPLTGYSICCPILVFPWFWVPYCTVLYTLSTTSLTNLRQTIVSISLVQVPKEILHAKGGSVFDVCVPVCVWCHVWEQCSFFRFLIMFGIQWSIYVITQTPQVCLPKSITHQIRAVGSCLFVCVYTWQYLISNQRA